LGDFRLCRRINSTATRGGNRLKPIERELDSLSFAGESIRRQREVEIGKADGRRTRFIAFCRRINSTATRGGNRLKPIERELDSLSFAGESIRRQREVEIG